ncbi:MAG: proline dehydrogenase family protein, partial [Chitinophagaceae bacterium]|nr:proline dehydrogenase family protein [Chitinophagaceae bacterium]
TIFSQFVGGETLEATKIVAQKLGEYNVQVILDYGVEGKEGEENFEEACEKFIAVIDYVATQPKIPYISVKVTGLARFALLEKLDAAMHQLPGSLMKRFLAAVDQLPPAEKEEWHRVRHRLMRICSTGVEKNTGVLIDAEETWIQEPVDAITMLMMDSFNKDKAFIFNTLQHYRHDRLAFLKDSYKAAAERGFIL